MIESIPPHNTMTDDLDRSIRAIYDAFSGYEFTDQIGDAAFPGSCNIKELHSVSLRSATSDQLDLFASDAACTWGTSEDFRHFLPRICELVAIEGQEGTIMPQIPFSALPRLSWREWPTAEVAVLEKYLDCLRDRSLNSFPQLDGGGINDPSHAWTLDAAHLWFETIAIATGETEPFLSAWRQQLEAESLAALVNLAAVFLDLTVYQKGKAPWNFFDHGSPIENEFLSWLRNIHPSSLLEQAFDRLEGSPLGPLFSTAQQQAERFSGGAEPR